MILVQVIYYRLTFVNFGYQLMLTLFVQLMGMGLAGILPLRSLPRNAV